MPVVKGGVWTNVEDEILKASVSKYGLNQWARVSSLLARKTPKQCKARWTEWLDPAIRKVEWSREEDEKLLHLAKLFPTQWHTIAPRVGRTATQCIQRYQKLLDEAEAKEAEELGLAGTEDSGAPSADDVRKLRVGEVDPDPESRPARPDAVDMEEEEKEMLSEARARLANTQGKKAKRKARERQLEDSRRLAMLQKRRELKTAGINIKLTKTKKGEMDYNADIPFEKAPAPGFYDTSDEANRNERERQAFDPRRSTNKKRTGEEDESHDQKRRKNDNKNAQSAAQLAAAQAGKLAKLREAERMSNRKSLNLPAPQVGESELEDIVKMGLLGERANKLAAESDNEATRSLLGDYATINTGIPIRTPMAAPQEDHIANEIRNIRALTNQQSSLLGGENTPLIDTSRTTGFDGVTPRARPVSTPNPLATPLRGAQPGGSGPTATPLRNPRDNLNINTPARNGALIPQTPREAVLQQRSQKEQLFASLASLPAPRQTDFEFEVTEDDPSGSMEAGAGMEEDSEVRDMRLRAQQLAIAEAEFKLRTQAVQRNLPRPSVVDIDALYHACAAQSSSSIEGMIALEMAHLVASDALKFPVLNGKVVGRPRAMVSLDKEVLAAARAEIAREIPAEVAAAANKDFQAAWNAVHNAPDMLPGLSGYGADGADELQIRLDIFDTVQEQLVADAEAAAKLEKRLGVVQGGYKKRAEMLGGKMVEATIAMREKQVELDSFTTLAMAEAAAIPRRLEALREEVAFLQKREDEAQKVYRNRREELEDGSQVVNGVH